MFTVEYEVAKSRGANRVCVCVCVGGGVFRVAGFGPFGLLEYMLKMYRFRIRELVAETEFC